MIINDENTIKKSLKAISKLKNGRNFQILPTGELQINGYFKSYVFIAYAHGEWFASFGNKKGSTKPIPESGVHLFAQGNNSLWIQNENGEVDISSPAFPLDTNTHVALFAFTGNSYSVIVADGSKWGAVISTEMSRDPANLTFLALSIIAMVRQYDESAADEIAEFWFHKEDPNSFEENKSWNGDQDIADEYASEDIEKKDKVVIQW